MKIKAYKAPRVPKAKAPKAYKLPKMPSMRSQKGVSWVGSSLTKSGATRSGHQRKTFFNW